MKKMGEVDMLDNNIIDYYSRKKVIVSYWDIDSKSPQAIIGHFHDNLATKYVNWIFVGKQLGIDYVTMVKPGA